MIAPPIAAAIRPYVGRLVVLALFSLAASGADIALSLTFRHLIDRVVRADQDIWRGVAFVVVLVLGLGAVKTAARMAIRTTSEAVGQGVALDLRVTLYSHLLRLPLAFFHQREVGRILVRFVSDLNAIRRFVSNGVSVALADGLAVICLVAATLVIDWRLGVGFLLVGPVEAIAVRRFNAPLRALNLTIRGQRARLSGLIQDSLSGIEAIKAYGREGKESARVARRSRKMRRDTLAQARVAAGAEGVSEALHAAATAYVLGVGGWLVMSGQMTTGTLVAFYSLFHHLAPAVRRLVRANEIAQTSRVQMGRVAAFLAREPEPASPDAVDADPSRRRSIVAHGVDGRWSFTALPGEIVAIVGPTGSGKSTLAGYLMGFGRPRSGRLTIDETDVSTTSPAALRAMVAWVTGDASLFRGSLVKNVRLGAPAASAVDIEAAVRASTLDRVAERLEAGLQHRVGSGGRRLSRGERALVSVARALLVQRPILILDDPFTGLDTETVDQIWGALEARRPSATTVIFTTDAAIAGRADRVFLLARAPDSHQPSTQPSEPIETL